MRHKKDIKRIPIADLKERLNALDAERESLLKLIEIYEKPEKEPVSIPEFTTRGQVVDAVVELIQTKKRYVTTREIFPFIEKKGLLKAEKDKKFMLAIILSQETKKKSPRLKKIARGVYDIK